MLTAFLGVPSFQNLSPQNLSFFLSYPVLDSLLSILSLKTKTRIFTGRSQRRDCNENSIVHSLEDTPYHN